MLRPEQLSVSVSGPQEKLPPLSRDVDFSGQLSTLTLSMAGTAAGVLRTVSQPRRGSQRDGGLTVSGKARVFGG